MHNSYVVQKKLNKILQSLRGGHLHDDSATHVATIESRESINGKVVRRNPPEQSSRYRTHNRCHYT
jgi:hypothetical protein